MKDEFNSLIRKSPEDDLVWVNKCWAGKK